MRRKETELREMKTPTVRWESVGFEVKQTQREVRLMG
jgi:hypothetical protein